MHFIRPGYLILPAMAVCSILANAQEPESALQAYMAEIRGPALRRQNLANIYQSGIVSLREGRYQQAEESFRSLYKQDPRDTQSLVGIAQVYLAENRKVEALNLIQSEIDQHPSRADLRVAFATIAEQAAEYDLAISALRVAVQLRPADSTAAITLARLLERSGRQDEAIAAYRAALGVDPNDGAALFGCATRASQRGGDLGLAIGCAERARRLLPESTELAETLGMIYLRTARWPQAVKLFEELLIHSPDSPTSHYHLGLALMMAGDHARALSESQEALNHNPAAEEADRIRNLIASLKGEQWL
jgi:tetratricopeptide (TPR) repeat protein